MKIVRDVMNTELVTIEANLSFDKILEIMIEKGIGKLPVIENDKLIGIVTRDDILVKEEEAPLPPVIAFWDLLITLPGNKEFKNKLSKISGYTAKEIMSKDYLVVKKNDELAKVITKIVETKYNYALVVDEDSIEGIVTKTDLVKKSWKYIVSSYY